MNYVIYKNGQFVRWLILCVSAVTLTACGAYAPADLDVAKASHVATVELEPGQSKAELAALYGGEVLVMDANEGFAVLSLGEPGENLSSQVLSLNLDLNLGAFTAPEPVTPQGASAWANGASAWANGASAWANGASAWANGASAWANGELTGTPADNHAIWQQIGLYGAHAERAPNLGQDVVVAVIDTGVDLEHPVFAGRLVPGWDFVDGDASPREELGALYGHGTAVAGVVLQVAPLATIMPLRVLGGNGAGDTDNVVLAIDRAIENGADIINLSLGSSETSYAVERLIRKARSHGIPVVASSGNSGDKNVLFPANASDDGGLLGTILGSTGQGLIGVGSVNTQDEKSAFSTYGQYQVETVAPGENVFTAYPDERIVYASGTSFAAPMVSGALALAMGEPTLNTWPQDLPQFVTNRVMDGLYDLPANGGDVKYALGKGRLDLGLFLDSVLR